MDVSMLDMAITAATALADPMRLAFLALGVFFGLILGVIPGLGGLVGLSLLLPFTFNMDPYTALAFLMGLQAVVVTSDTIPAVLFGVPGTVGSAATILDGYPMARKGEAGRAFGAAFTASVLGGLYGAFLLALAVPVIRPIILNIASPELFAICIFGLSLVAVLSGGTPLKGLAAACIGVLVAMTGEDSQTGTFRWTFDTLYLWDGIPVVPIALGLFAVPEIADMVISRKSIAGNSDVGSRWAQWEGVKDVFRNKFLMFRCSTIGAGLGAVPGIGASVIDWIAYGHAVRTIKDSGKTFGKGDVRGVIASESSNNAKEGGALLPTIAFGVPGSASMALILGAFLIHGLVPGPEMLNTRLDITYTLVWSVAIANILGAGTCFLFAGQLAKIALVRIGILAPVVLAITFIGAFQGAKSWGDIVTLLAMGFVGWIMKRMHWPRPPLILGFVLGALIERYMFISVERYGWEWLWVVREGEFHPWVVIIFAITLYGVLSPIIRSYIARRKQGVSRGLTLGCRPEAMNPDTYFTFVVIVLFAVVLFVSAEWELAARLVPQVMSTAGILFAGGIVFLRFFVVPKPVEASAVAGSDAAAGVVEKNKADAFAVDGEDVHFDIKADYGDLSVMEIFRRAAVYFGWLLFFFAVAGVIGLLPSMFVFLAGYMRFAGGESWKTTLSIAVPMWIVSYLLFHVLLIVPWPQSLMGVWLPELKSNIWLNLF
jgi:TctA family transporter